MPPGLARNVHTMKGEGSKQEGAGRSAYDAVVARGRGRLLRPVQLGRAAAGGGAAAAGGRPGWAAWAGARLGGQGAGAAHAHAAGPGGGVLRGHPPAGGMSNADLSRVVQGMVAGVGFLGAGAILKRDDRTHVRGMTTAAGLWLTAAVGTAAGFGRGASAVLVTL